MGGGWGGGDNPLPRLELNPGDFTPREGGDADLRGEGDNPQLMLTYVTTCSTVGFY